MNKIFTAIDKSKKRIFIKKNIFFSAILIILLGVIYAEKVEEDGLFTKIYSFIFLTWIFLNIVSNFFISSYKVIGYINFSDETIELPKLKIKINEIEFLKVNYTVSHKFLIDYKQDIEILKRVLLYYKQKGLNVSYTYKGKTVI